MNLVLEARHFQFRVEVSFKEIIVDGLLEKIKYYVVRVEFQVEDSPHMHSLLWVLSAPVEHYKEWGNIIISAGIPDPTGIPDPKHIELVKYASSTDTRK